MVGRHIVHKPVSSGIQVEYSGKDDCRQMSRFRLQSVLLSESFCADKESASEHEFAGDVGLFFLAAMLSGSGFVRKLRTAFSKGKDRRFIRKRVSCHFTAAHAVFYSVARSNTTRYG